MESNGRTGNGMETYETMFPAVFETETETETTKVAPMIFALPPESTDEIIARIARDWR